MKYLSVFSGIEAASVAWHPLGWSPVAFAEIEKFPSAVLAHRFPGVPNWGDVTKFKEWPDASFDVLVGGSPCQSFSVAGLRKGLDDPRGNLTLTFLAIVGRYLPVWIVWGNVPGVLSERSGAFGTFLGGLAELGYGFSYRILDAQYFGLAQRRKRVFVVGHLGDWRPAAAVLLERESLFGDSPPSREKGEGTTYSVAPCIGASGRGFERAGETRGQDPVVAVAQNQIGEVRVGDVANTLGTNSNPSGRNAPIVFLSGQGAKAGSVAASEHTSPTLKSSSGGNMVPAVVTPSWWDGSQQAASLTTRCHEQSMPDKGNFSAVVDFGRTADRIRINAEVSLNATDRHAVAIPTAVRRLTPRECERLQGFPDDFTNIPQKGRSSPDGPRYKALGNSMAVPVIQWIGKRIQMFEQLKKEGKL